MVTLVKAPWKILKDVQSRRSATGKLFRDDPAFHVLLTGLLILSSLLWGLTTGSIKETVKLIFYVVLVDFLVVGFVLSTIGYVLCNYMLRKKDPSRLAPVEWSYFLDVHSNSFLFVYLYLYVAQLFLLPIVNHGNWVSVVISDLLYLAAALHYCVISLLGYSVVWDKDLTIQSVWIGIMFFNVTLFLGCVLSKVCITQVIMNAYFR